MLKLLKSLLSKRSINNELPTLDFDEFETANQNTNLLDNKFKDTIQFFNDNPIKTNNGKKSATQLPWYLIIGASNAGKTTLLAKSGINFSLAKKFKGNITHTKEIDWWVSDHHAFIDVNGQYISNKRNKAVLQFTWLKLLALPKKHKGKNAFAGIIVVIDLAEALNQSTRKRNDTFEELASQVHRIRHSYSKDLPITIVFNKADKLPGFTAYFQNLEQAHREQSFGIKLPLENDKQVFRQTISREFTNLLDQINLALLHQLDQQQDKQTRQLAQEFPIQMESLRKITLDFVRKLTDDDSFFDHTVVAGIYFTSACSQGSSNQLIGGESSTLPSVKTDQDNKTFFIKELLDKIILQPTLPKIGNKISKKSQSLYRRIYYGIGIATFILATIIIHDYFIHADIMKLTKKSLTQYEQTQGKTLPTSIKSATLLNKAFQQLDDRNHYILPLFFIHRHNRLEILVKNKLQQQLQQVIIPKVGNNLQQAMINAHNNENNLAVYTALKSYLMLTEPAHFESPFLRQWLPQELSSLKLTQQQINNLVAILKVNINKQAYRLPVNQTLISDAREQLNNLSKQQLGTIILESNLGKSKTLAVDANTKNQISIAAFQAIAGNWVIGPKSHTAPINQLNQLADTLKLPLINKIWQDNIYKTFINDIQTKYPLNPDASSDLDLQEFSKFYGPKGVLENFYQKYLATYVKQKNTTGLSQQAVKQIKTLLAKVKQLYTGDALKFRFNVSSYGLRANTKEALLQYNDNDFLFTQDSSPTTKNYSWPPKTKLTITLNKTKLLQAVGPWEWQRLIQNAKISPATTTQMTEFNVGFTKDDLLDEYKVTLPTTFNFFDQKTLAELLTLPKSLLE